jgi:hypothetical protein
MFRADNSTERLHDATDVGAGYDGGISGEKRKIRPLCELVIVPSPRAYADF